MSASGHLRARTVEGPPGTPAEARRRFRVFVVLPAYNEEANIGSLLDRLDESMENSLLPYEAIVIDDGSQDGTAEVLTRCAGEFPNSGTAIGRLP